ncbi:hypothetical protein [Sphingobacterium sp. LRF_L2]|uniref:hypothetical protein n=1 Tax=Sphingobacterium sp. LRF_L2 TaxID=3369421 RepID=UPI003F5D61BF
MTDETFHIATLHRGKYMLLLLVGVCLVTALASRLTVDEILKILLVLVSLPLLLFGATKWSRNTSYWTIGSDQISIRFHNEKEEQLTLSDIKYIRNLPRSGGNLLMIFCKSSRIPKRYWRNKLFQKADDLDALLHALKTRDIEYYYM